MKVILIDDEPLAREVVKAHLRKFPELEVVAECNDGFEGVKAIQQHQPDLIFLDIQMPKINGFEMLELIDTKPAVIFVTAYDRYAIQAFEANAVDYLLKPVSDERFYQAVQKWNIHNPAPAVPNVDGVLNTMSKTLPQQQRIVVKTGTKVRIIPVHEVHYLEADDDYVKVVTAEGSFLKNKTMGFYETILDPQQFVRIHRSYLVHVNQITRIDPYHKETHLAVLRSGTSLPVSKTGYGRLKEVLGV